MALGIAWLEGTPFASPPLMIRCKAWALLLAVTGAAIAGCSSEPESLTGRRRDTAPPASAGGGGGAPAAGTQAPPPAGAETGPDPLDSEVDPLAGLKQGAAQLQALCARNGGDAVSLAFCGATAPTIGSLADLQKAVGLDFKPGNNGNGTGGNPAFSITGHSTSLVTRFTSAINPRALIFTPPKSDGRVTTPNPLASFVAMGFVRGEQFVELVSNDPTRNNELTFFLFRFEQACNQKAGGCRPGDLLTPAVESAFTSYSLYHEADIKNTVLDCLQCHQPGGPSTPKLLRMQELQRPWGHWITANETPNGAALLADYRAAHGANETYAGIPGAAIGNSNPEQLEGLVENQGFQQQPNEFNSNQILDKNDTGAWQTLYDAARTGKQIPAPFHQNRVTDPTKLTSMTNAYKSVMGGTTPAASLPDIRDVFLDSAAADLTFRPAQSLVAAKDGKAILVQMCQQCHNPSLDQTLTRAKFDVTKLATMDRAEKDKAIARLTLPREAFRRMPPTRFRELSDDEIQLVADELKK